MTTSQIALHPFAFFRASGASGAAAGRTGAVAAGAAVSLSPTVPLTLRIAEGQAWVTLGQGLVDGGDVVLCAGQSLPLAAGQKVVIEALGGRRLQYRCTREQAASAARATWWRRASLGDGAPVAGAWGDACYA